MRLLVRLLVIFLFTVMVYGCAGVGLWGTKKDAGYGPPPHAPAHGYRHKHHGVEMVFDTGMGLYVVTGYPKHYFHNNNYYRFRDGIWEVSLNIGGSWVLITDAGLPPGLKKKWKKQKKQKKK